MSRIFYRGYELKQITKDCVLVTHADSGVTKKMIGVLTQDTIQNFIINFGK